MGIGLVLVNMAISLPVPNFMVVIPAQKAGKNLYLLVDPSEIEFILENLSAKGLFLNTFADSEDEANEIIKKVEKWSVNRN